MPAQDTYVALPNGSYVRVPADATPDQLSALRSRLGSTAKPAFGSDALSQATSIGPQESQGPLIDTLNKVRNWLQTKATTGSQSGAGQFMLSAPIGATDATKGALEMFTPGQSTWRGAKDLVGGVLQAATMPSMVMAPEAAEGAAGLIPSTERAGRKFQEVMGAARDVPIKAGEPIAEATRGKEIASRGGQLPKILRDFVRRTSDVSAPPITYEEARDFYTNARLSMSEYLQNKPNMWRQVTIFKKALGDAVQQAAQEAGKGPEYRSAMDEYRKAIVMQNLIKSAAKIGIPLALGYEGNKALGLLSKVGGQ